MPCRTLSVQVILSQRKHIFLKSCSALFRMFFPYVHLFWLDKWCMIHLLTIIFVRWYKWNNKRRGSEEWNWVLQETHRKSAEVHLYQNRRIWNSARCGHSVERKQGSDTGFSAGSGNGRDWCHSDQSCPYGSHRISACYFPGIPPGDDLYDAHDHGPDPGPSAGFP